MREVGRRSGGNAWRRTGSIAAIAFVLAPSIGIARGINDVASAEEVQQSAPPTDDPQDLDMVRRLSLMRPFDGGFDVPVVGAKVHAYLMFDAAT
jgi:hypothetical protein